MLESQREVPVFQDYSKYLSLLWRKQSHEIVVEVVETYSEVDNINNPKIEVKITDEKN